MSTSKALRDADWPNWVKGDSPYEPIHPNRVPEPVEPPTSAPQPWSGVCTTSHAIGAPGLACAAGTAFPPLHRPETYSPPYISDAIPPGYPYPSIAPPNFYTMPPSTLQAPRTLSRLREDAAIAAMQAMLAAGARVPSDAELADRAVKMADALMERLSKS